MEEKHRFRSVSFRKVSGGETSKTEQWPLSTQSQHQYPLSSPSLTSRSHGWLLLCPPNKTNKRIHNAPPPPIPSIPSCRFCRACRLPKIRAARRHSDSPHLPSRFKMPHPAESRPVRALRTFRLFLSAAFLVVVVVGVDGRERQVRSARTGRDSAGWGILNLDGRCGESLWRRAARIFGSRHALQNLPRGDRGNGRRRCIVDSLVGLLGAGKVVASRVIGSQRRRGQRILVRD